MNTNPVELREREGERACNVLTQHSAQFAPVQPEGW